MSHLRRLRLTAPPGSGPATVRHLLTHQSGLETTKHWAVAPGEHRPSLPEHYDGEVASEFAPGTRWRYGNDGFAVAGQLVEDVDCRFYEQYVHEEIFGPLRMTSSDFLGHGRGRQIIVRPAGGAFTTCADVAHYLRWLVRDDKGPLLPNAAFELMTVPTPTAFGLEPDGHAIGLGFRLAERSGHRVLFHDGSVSPFSVAMRTCPARNLAVLAWLPRIDTNRHDIGDALFDAVW